MDDRETIEWTTLKSLRSHRHRFAKFRLQNLEAVREARLQNDVRFLDSGLRQLFNRTDLDDLDGYRFHDEATAKIFQGHLESLCSLLDKCVRAELLSSSPPEPERLKYPRLSALATTLAATDWEFELVSADKGRSIFQPNPVSDAAPERAREPDHLSTAWPAKNPVDAFNDFLNGLRRPMAEKVPAKGNTAAQSFRNRTLLALNALFSSLETIQDCHHEVLVELPDWPTIESEESSSGRGMNLFLSECLDKLKEKPDWHEGRIDNDTSCSAGTPYHVLHSICDGIRNSRAEEGSLQLLIQDEKVVVADDKSYPKSYPEYYPAKTLEDLLDGRFFVDIQDWNPAIPQNRFLTREKRSLAVSLVLSHATYLGCRFAIEPWDSKQIYFLVGTEDHCIRHAAYALCFIKGQSDRPPTASFPLPSVIDLTPLAKLLLEIECGFKLDDGPTVGANDSERNRLSKKIGSWLYKSQDLGQKAYLEAVKECLDFEQTCRRALRGADAADPRVDHATTARSVLYTRIAKRIQNTVPQPKRKRTRLPVGPSNGYSSGDRRQLGSVPARRQDARPHKRPKRTTRDETARHLMPCTVDSDLYPSDSDPKASLSHLRSGTCLYAVRRVEDESWASADATPDKKLAVCESWSLDNKNDLALFGRHEKHDRCEDCASTSKWMYDFKGLRKPSFREAREAPLKIAILDTGIDMRHPIIADERSRIKGGKTWRGGCAYEDDNGHGTFVAGILLDLTTNVDLFIGKIMDSEVCESRDHIAQAIQHARDIWRVDMISLSFGYRVSNVKDAVADEIRECVKKDILVFAAASNDGGRRNRTSPANYDQVFCIHASNGIGGKWGFNPAPVQGTKEDNFSVVGQCVAWPHMAHPEVGVTEQYRSGTSFATPVAVSIAVFMIQFIKQKMASCRWNIDPCTPAGMTKIFRELKADIDGYEWVCPERYLTATGHEMACLRLKELLGGYEV